MEGNFSAGQNPQWAVVPMEEEIEEEEEEEEEEEAYIISEGFKELVLKVARPRFLTGS